MARPRNSSSPTMKQSPASRSPEIVIPAIKPIATPKMTPKTGVGGKFTMPNASGNGRSNAQPKMSPAPPTPFAQPAVSPPIPTPAPKVNSNARAVTNGVGLGRMKPNQPTLGQNRGMNGGVSMRKQGPKMGGPPSATKKGYGL